MDKEKRQAPFVNIGSALLLVIFLVLCLATFAALSLSSARSDYSFSERLANRKSAYYQASNQAEEILAQIDGVLAEAAANDGKSSWGKLDFSGIDADIEHKSGSTSISYQVAIDEKQALDVQLALNSQENFPTKGYYRIERWQIINTREWKNDDTLHLMPIE